MRKRDFDPDSLVRLSGDPRAAWLDLIWSAVVGVAVGLLECALLILAFCWVLRNGIFVSSKWYDMLVVICLLLPGPALLLLYQRRRREDDWVMHGVRRTGLRIGCGVLSFAAMVGGVLLGWVLYSSVLVAVVMAFMP